MYTKEINSTNWDLDRDLLLDLWCLGDLRLERGDLDLWLSWPDGVNVQLVSKNMLINYFYTKKGKLLIKSKIIKWNCIRINLRLLSWSRVRSLSRERDLDLERLRLSESERTKIYTPKLRKLQSCITNIKVSINSSNSIKTSSKE